MAMYPDQIRLFILWSLLLDTHSYQNNSVSNHLKTKQQNLVLDFAVMSNRHSMPHLCLYQVYKQPRRYSILFPGLWRNHLENAMCFTFAYYPKLYFKKIELLYFGYLLMIVSQYAGKVDVLQLHCSQFSPELDSVSMSHSLMFSSFFHYPMDWHPSDSDSTVTLI